MNLKTRENRHRRQVNALRERKRLRTLRREIHEAMEQARRMARSRRRGTSRNPDENMKRLGWERIQEKGSVEEKYKKIKN